MSLKVTMEMCELEFGGYFGEKGIYFQGDEVSGTLNYDHLQHKRITGKIVLVVYIYLYTLFNEGETHLAGIKLFYHVNATYIQKVHSHDIII